MHPVLRTTAAKTTQVNIYEATTHLSSLVEGVEHPGLGLSPVAAPQMLGQAGQRGVHPVLTPAGGRQREGCGSDGQPVVAEQAGVVVQQ